MGGPDPSPPYFVTTRWSVILASQGGRSAEEKSAVALRELCQIYWQPIYLYLRRRGYQVADAEDLTQGFFVMILDSQFIAKVEKQRGRFRAFLLTSLQNFVRNANAERLTQKRGGGKQFLSLHDSDLSESDILAQNPQASADEIFDLGWAMKLSHRALARLREECQRKGRERVFLELQVFLAPDETAWESSVASRRLGLNDGQIRMLVLRLRQRYRVLLREEVAETVADSGELENELRHLQRIVAGQPVPS